MIQITDSLALDESELDFDFVRASGPGGQNVNKVATAVQLRFDARHSPSLPEPVRQRLEALAGKQMTSDGVLVIDARRYRSQARNREDALERLVDLLRQAAQPPKVRRPSKPPAAAKQQRLQAKRRQSERKRQRGRVALPED